MRKAFVNTLIKETRKNKKIMLLSGDLGFNLFEEFQDKFPENFINVGVAEQNMMGIATGLALSGRIVFAYSIATFATMRAFEQIRNDIASHKASVVIVGSGGGLCYGQAGLTHHAIEDLNLMRGVPGMTVLCPADPIEVKWATRLSVKLKKPVYLRLGKKGELTLYHHTPRLRLGKAHILNKGKDVAILATGNIVSNVLKAAKILSEKNIKATVASMHTLKPIDGNLIRKFSKKFPFLITVEEHSVIGGLGSAVAEVLTEQECNMRLLRLGIPDRFVTQIGSQNFLRERLGLTPEKIAAKIYRVLKK